MRKIILTTSLFFCLSITTILAAVVTTNIAAPVAGLSTNSVTDFDVNSDGTILNNSATGGTALGTAVTANSNITAGSEASLILLQVTGTSGSDLGGTIEVFGGEAGLIIANPNGITCNGCGFTNVNRVDLVTGSGYDAGTNTFSTIAATDITVVGGLLANNVAVNIQTGADFINNTTINADSLTVIAGDDFANNSGATINANTLTIEVTNFANDISNTGTISSDSLNLILTDSFINGDDSFNGFNFSNLAIKTFSFSNNGKITVNSFTFEGDYFANSGIDVVIDAASFTVTATNVFRHELATINADSFNVIAGTYSANRSTVNADNFTVTANEFGNRNLATINADTVTIEVPDFVDVSNVGGTVSSDSLNFIFTDNFDSSSNFFPGFNNFSNVAITTSGIFTNNHTIAPDSNLTITANTFTNNATINPTGNLTIVAATFLNAASATIAAAECDIIATSYTDNGTITCLDSEVVAMVIDIETPVDGFSNNSVVSFDVSADGTILNNSAVGGTAQFRSTDVEGNSNITAGSEADLILLQVTGSTGSALNGTIEVFGAEAGLIIANPNGITCNGCGFINANRVDLVTGNNYNASTNTFGSIAAANIDIAGSGLAASVLKIQTGADFSNSATINADSLTVIAGDDFANNSGATINADTVTIEVTNFANDIGNSGTVLSDSLNFILTDGFTHSSTSFTGFNNFSNLAITTEGTFTNTATINPTGNTAITANSFINTGGVVNADTFALSVAGNFDYANKGTITATAFNFNVGGDFSYDDTNNDFTWGDSDTLTVSGNVNIVAADFANSGAITVTNSGNFTANTFANSGGVLNADAFTLSVAGDFDYDEGTITANTTNLTVGGDFSYDDSANDLDWGVNDILTVSGHANIVAAGFANSGTITVTNSLNLTSNTFSNGGGVVSADTFNLDVAGAFDYIADYANGTITTNALNLDVGGNFSYNDAANDLTWRATDTLTVSGNANIVAADFSNSGTINVTNSFDITATDFTNAQTISANSFNATVATFSNQSGATITAAECNLVVHTSSSDNGTITCLDSINTAITNIAVPNSNGLSTNSYETFHIPNSGVVFNNSDSDATSQLLGDISKNPNYNDGDAASIILAQVTGTEISLLVGTLEVVGAEAVVIIANPNGIGCNGCSFINASRVDLVTGSSYNFNADRFNNIANGNIDIIENGLDASSVGILNIHAGSFTNTGVLKANTFNLSVIGDFDNTQRGIINATIFNLEVGGDFSNNDATTGFVWEERDTLTVLGDANITALNFINHGTINVAGSGSSGSFEITSGYTAINQGSIVSDILDINAADFFRNLTGGDIDVATLNITAGGKVTNTANINVTGTLSITANNDSTRTDDRTGFYVSNRGNITATNLNITAVDNFYNRGNITATNFTTSAKSVFLLNREINSFYAAGDTYDGGNISLAGDSSLIAAGIIENYGNIDLGSNNLDISADSFTNHASANVTANTVNLAVTSYINDGTIDAVIVSDTTNDQ